MTDHPQGRVLIVGGAAEARMLAGHIAGALVVLPGAERVSSRWPCEVRHGAVCARMLHRDGITAVIEAAHPCDTATAFLVAGAAQLAGIAHLQLVRPEWRPGARDRWVQLRDLAQVPHVVPEGARLFATVGRADLPGLKAFRGLVLARLIGQRCHGFPLRRGGFLTGTGPFSVAEEMALLRRFRIDWMVLRNAGGAGGWPKLAAARQLGLPVAMLARPRRPGGASVPTVKEALKWLDHRRISVA